MAGRGMLLLLLLFCAVRDGLARVELEKTPHPCKASYGDAEVAAWVSEHLKGKKEGAERPHLLLMLGGSGAGKGTFIDRWKAMEGGGKAVPLSEFVFHGLDEYLPYIPEYARTIRDEENVYKDAADACYSSAAIPAAKLAGNEIVARRINLIYEETGKNVDRIKKRVLPAFVEAGYRITAVLIHNDADTAIKRSSARFQRTGRYAPDDYIRGTFENNFKSYGVLRSMESIAESVYCDNSGEELRCWRDGQRDDGASLLPDEMVLPGSPKYGMGAKGEEL